MLRFNAYHGIHVGSPLVVIRDTAPSMIS